MPCFLKVLYGYRNWGKIMVKLIHPFVSKQNVFDDIMHVKHETHKIVKIKHAFIDRLMIHNI